MRKTIDIERFSRDVHQLWAEAVVREQAGEPITLSQHLWQAAAELQAVRMVEDSFEVVLEGWFNDRIGRVSLESIKLLLGFEGGKMLPTEAQRLKRIMDRLGWEYGSHRLRDLGQTSNVPRKGFARGTEEERKVEWIAKRVDGGIAVLVRLGESADNDMPF